MSDPRTLYRLQARLEGLTIEAGHASRLIDTPGESGPPACMQVVRYSRGDSEVIFRKGLEDRVEARLRSLWDEIAEGNTADPTDLRIPGVERHGHHVTFAADSPVAVPAASYATLANRADPRLRQSGSAFRNPPHGEVVLLQVGSEVVAAVGSARENNESGELWVHTAERHRRRGHGKVASAV